MKIQRVLIKNYKVFKELDLPINSDINIIVGNNEAGKTTLLEAIHLALSLQINYQSLRFGISPYLFNKEVVDSYIAQLQTNSNAPLPEILIELYFAEDENQDLNRLRGNNNTKNEDRLGLFLRIFFDNQYSRQYKEYIKDPSKVKTIPAEFYTYDWSSFANNPLTITKMPCQSTFLNCTESRYNNTQDKHLYEILSTSLSREETAQLNLTYRTLKESFSTEDAIKKINETLQSSSSDITDKNLSVSVDISNKSTWETNLTFYLNDIPFKNIGKGEQNAIKTKLVVQGCKEENHIILLEEPETNLSFSNMNKLVHHIASNCNSNQLFISTHSSFIMNTVGLKNTILLNKDNAVTMSGLPEETIDFFRKLPGFDTLRLVLSNTIILVEGPSDELIVKKAYMQKYHIQPLDKGIDIMSVGLAFKRFLEIAKLLKKTVFVITDNDGNIDGLQKKYQEYLDEKNSTIKICYHKNPHNNTLEPCIVDCNELSTLNKILNRKEQTKAELAKYMQMNKTKCALSLFDTDIPFVIPDYIQEVVNEL